VTRRRRIVAGSLLGPLALALLLVVINRPWFDEALAPELVALRASKVEFSGDNAYPEVAAFPRADHRSIKLESLDCVARRYLDCAARLIAQVGATNWQSPELNAHLERYEAFLRHAHYVETREAGEGAPAWLNTSILNLGQLRLALSYQQDATPAFLRKVADDFRFWVTVLREGESMQAKMVALAAIQNDVDYLSTRMRERPLDPAELQFVQDFVRPFTREETDIGSGFMSEVRLDLMLDEPYVAMETSGLTRLLLQKNATRNLGYREIVVPMLARAKLDARQWFEQHAHEPIRYELRVRPRTLFNLGGKLAWTRSAWDPWQFPPRVHDQNGRISLLLLQAEIAARPDVEPEKVIRESAHRNPYTGEAMEYDGQAGTISFECRHTAFHPPDPPDRCAVAIHRSAS